MTVPASFYEFVDSLHQDLDADGAEPSRWILLALKSLKKSQRLELKTYLDELVSKEVDRNGLGEIWRNASPNWGVSDDELPRFFRYVRDNITLDE